MSPLGQGDIFQRIYQDMLEIKQDLESKEYPEHEWIDWDYVCPTYIQDGQYVVVDDLNLKDDKK